jgi:hypothetical protein
VESDLTAELMVDVDPRLFNFLTYQVDSFIKWDLVRFFHENPGAVDTAANTARYAGRDQSSVEKELGELANSGVLEQDEIGGMTVYALSGSQDMRELVEQFVSACDDRRFRVRALYHITRGLKPGGM